MVTHWDLVLFSLANCVEGPGSIVGNATGPFGGRTEGVAEAA
jgi:hypothetical protein